MTDKRDEAANQVSNGAGESGRAPPKPTAVETSSIEVDETSDEAKPEPTVAVETSSVNVGTSNEVDETSDEAKPESTAVETSSGNVETSDQTTADISPTEQSDRAVVNLCFSF